MGQIKNIKLHIVTDIKINQIILVYKSLGVTMVRSVDSGDDKRSEKSKDSHESGMRVGSEFQARIPDILTDEETDHRPEPILVWAPVEDKVSDSKLDTYLKVAKDQYGYNMEQALGMLYWHSYESDKAMEDLKNFTPLPDE